MHELTNFASGTAEEKKLFNKIKHNLEMYRELLLEIDDLLKWKKKFYPGIIFGVITMVFLLLWKWDLSMISSLAIAMIYVILVDYLYPIISRLIIKPENWTGPKEKHFDVVCNDMCSIWMSLKHIFDLLFTKREGKSSYHYLVTLSVMIVMAYIGSVVNNLLFTYFLILTTAMYPGLLHHGIIDQYGSKLTSFVSKKIKKTTQKAE